MNNSERNRRQVAIGAELLESRQLLNAHVPHHPTVHVASASTHAVHQVSGTLTGPANYTENTVNTLLGTDTYSLSGKTNHGVVSLIANDSDTSPNDSPTTYHDVYSGGNSTMTLNDGSTIAISYVGSGHSSSVNPHFTATLEGKGIGTSGAELGHVYSFTAKLVGKELSTQNGSEVVTIKFNLKG